MEEAEGGGGANRTQTTMSALPWPIGPILSVRAYGRVRRRAAGGGRARDGARAARSRRGTGAMRRRGGAVCALPPPPFLRRSSAVDRDPCRSDPFSPSPPLAGSSDDAAAATLHRVLPLHHLWPRVLPQQPDLLPAGPHTPAVHQTRILLHPPMPVVGASIVMERERQQPGLLPARPAHTSPRTSPEPLRAQRKPPPPTCLWRCAGCFRSSSWRRAS